MTEKQKVVIYVVRDGQLLVFRHMDFPMEVTGIQVPAGTIEERESPDDAALRELQEETGKNDFKIISFLGTDTYNKAPEKLEIHHRHFFLAELTESLPERWESQESHDGVGEPTRLEFFWIPLEHGHVLVSGQGALLSKI